MYLYTSTRGGGAGRWSTHFPPARPPLQKTEGHMPARSKDERERRRKEFEERKAARKAAKAAAGDRTGADGGIAGPADASGDDANKKQVDLSRLSPEEANATSAISQLSGESVHQLLSFLPSKELGGTTLTCRLLNYALKEGRIQHLLSRLKDGRRRETDATVLINMLGNESEARDLLEWSLGIIDDDTGRLRTKKSKRKGDDCGADEYVAYARFLESAVLGYETQDFGGREATVLPSCVNGRFVSVSPEHSLCRVGGGGDKSGAGGSGVSSWGVGARGQLGLGKQEDKREPTRLMMGIGYGIRIVQVSAGGGLVRVAHSLLLTSTGRVLSFGCASHGQLGHGFTSSGVLHDEFRPKYIDALARERIVNISAGELHSAAVNADGDVYTWGEGFCGQLGHAAVSSGNICGDKRPQMLPKQIESGGIEDEVVTSVSCGARHTLFVTEDGEVFSTGLGHFGVLGRSYTPFEYDADAALSGMVEDLPEEEAAEAAQPAAPAAPTAQAETNTGISEETRAHLDLLANLTLDDASDQCYPVIIDSLQGVKIIGASAGHRHSMVLDDKGRLYSFGTGTAGCLGHGDCLKQSFPVMIQEFAQNDISIINFSAGVDISMAISAAGDVYSWGKTDGGRIGLGNTKTSVSIPRRVTLPNVGNVKAVDVDCSYVHSLIVGLDGSVYQCGGVGVDGADDGQNLADELSADDIRAGRPFKLKGFNIWHRCAEPKLQKSTERWKKYGSYEVKGRANMMGEADKWST